MTTSQIIQISTHKLSQVQGVYVIAQHDKVCAVFTNIALVTEWLGDVKYKEAADVRIILSCLDDLDTDDITHLIADDLLGDYRDYTAFKESEGYDFPWLEYWADEIDTHPYAQDIKRRTDRRREIFAPLRSEQFEGSEVSRVAAE